jgi:hypothetical protein
LRWERDRAYGSHVNLSGAKVLAAAFLTLVVAGCNGDIGPLLTAETSHAPQFGYVDVTFHGDVASLGDIRSVTLGGVPAYNVRGTASSLTVTVQGAPEPGPAILEVVGSSGRALRHTAFTYDAPPAGTPRVWVAFGASLTQGTESEGIDEHTQLFGVSAQIARQAGVYFPLPILQDGIATPLHPTDFNLDCSQKAGTGLNPNKLLDRVTDPATGFFDLTRARKAYATTPQDLAVGGSKVAHILRGGTGVVAVLEHAVEEPTIDPGDVVGNVDISQIQRVEMLDPDVAFSTDLLANDLDTTVLEGDDLHPDYATPLSMVQPMLVEMMQRLGQLHGQYFIANLPSLTFIPNVGDLRQARVANGSDTEASFDAKVAAIDQITAQYNQALADAMAPYPNLHLIDFAARVKMVGMTGIRAGGERCTTARFGGLLSFDFLHFSDTAYGYYANIFIEQLNAALGLAIPPTDLDAIHAGDEAAPSKLRAQGFTCVPPPSETEARIR